MMGMILVSLMPILRLVGTLWTGRLMRHRKPHWAYWSLSNIHIPYLVGVWPLERISHLSRRRLIMETKKRIRLIWMALLSLSGVLPAVATDYEASDYLPLAVGNSWTYAHEYYAFDTNNGGFEQYSAYVDQFPIPAPGEPYGFPEFTISVLNTEVIDGKTYYVLSDMPANWPPAPPHFIAGKKLRWEGTHLMERTTDGEQAIYRFDGANDTGYAVETDEGDTRVTVIAGDDSLPWLSSGDPFPWHGFYFHGHLAGTRVYGFTLGYGLHRGGWGIAASDHPLFTNGVKLVRAVLGGRTLDATGPLTPTGTSSSSWGQVKEEVH